MDNLSPLPARKGKDFSACGGKKGSCQELHGKLSTLIHNVHSRKNKCLKYFWREAYTKTKQTYENALEKLDNDDWKYFVEQDLKSINESIEEQKLLKPNTSHLLYFYLTFYTIMLK